MSTRITSAEEAEAAVKMQHPHFSLVPQSYQSKSLPATWRCNLHDVAFRYPVTNLARSGCLGCPVCKEERAFAKRREQYADPALERHIKQIRRHLGEDFATIWRMRCEAAKLLEIGDRFGKSEQSISNKLGLIRKLLSGSPR